MILYMIHCTALRNSSEFQIPNWYHSSKTCGLTVVLVCLLAITTYFWVTRSWDHYQFSWLSVLVFLFPPYFLWPSEEGYKLGIPGIDFFDHVPVHNKLGCMGNLCVNRKWKNWSHNLRRTSFCWYLFGWWQFWNWKISIYIITNNDV